MIAGEKSWMFGFSTMLWSSLTNMEPDGFFETNSVTLFTSEGILRLFVSTLWIQPGSIMSIMLSLKLTPIRSFMRKIKEFTVIEYMIIVVIIGLALAMIAVPMYQSIRDDETLKFIERQQHGMPLSYSEQRRVDEYWKDHREYGHDNGNGTFSLYKKMTIDGREYILVPVEDFNRKLQ
jgi:Flp pilus assembly pilin Flp